MKTRHILSTFAASILLLTLGLCAAEKDPVPTWTDPDKAAEEHPDFLLQGEYTGEDEAGPMALQAADLDGGKFLVLTYRGGLPGDGWDGGKLKSEVLDRDALAKAIGGLERVIRSSETEGMSPPEGAIVLFNGEENENIKGEVSDGLLWAGSESTVETGDFQLHLEFRLPFKPSRKPSSQDRGNSGVYIFNNYECQVLDSFGLDFVPENNAIDLDSLNTQWCGAFYKFKTPDLPMSYPPLSWQTYDIDFTAPRFENGEKVKNARITVRHNGVVIHDDLELPGGTGAGAKRPESSKGRIFFQGHGNPTAFRNVWIVEKK